MKLGVGGTCFISVIILNVIPINSEAFLGTRSDSEKDLSGSASVPSFVVELRPVVSKPQLGRFDNVSLGTGKFKNLSLGTGSQSLKRGTRVMPKPRFLAGAIPVAFPFFGPPGTSSPAPQAYVISAAVLSSVRHKKAPGGSDSNSEWQDFDVLLDTGSSSLLLPSDECMGWSCPKAEERRFSLSAAARRTPLRPVRYLGGNMQARLAEADEVCVGTRKAAQLKSSASSAPNPEEFDDAPPCLSAFHVLAAQCFSIGFEDYDGILGLGLPPANSTVRSLVGELLKASRAPHVFALLLSANEAQVKSHVSFGVHHADRLAEGPLTWVPLSQNPYGYWAFELDQVVIAGKSLLHSGICGASQKCLAVLDTGCSGLLASNALVRSITANLEVSEKCVNIDELPSLVFKANGKDAAFELRSSDYVRRSAQTTGCQLAMDELPKKGLPQNVVVLGLPFLRRYYSVYDADSSKIGLAIARQGSHVSRSGLFKNLGRRH